MIPRNWKIVGVTTLALGGLTGVAIGRRRHRPERPQPTPIALADQAPPTTTTTTRQPTVDPSPESADSPAESPFDSVESPTDSPDDPGYVDPSPESADSPAESPFDSRRVADRQPGRSRLRRPVAGVG